LLSTSTDIGGVEERRDGREPGGTARAILIASEKQVLYNPKLAVRNERDSPCRLATDARWAAAAIAACALTVGLASRAQAQAVVNSDTAPGDTSVQVGFNGIVDSSIQLTIVGTGPTTLSNIVSALAPTHASATINFGSFTTLAPWLANNANGYRTTSGTDGAIVAARLLASVTYNGASTASILLGRAVPAGAAPDVPLANLRVASPPLATWTAGTNGTQIPDAGQLGYDLCVAAGDATCQNGLDYPHQLAVFVPDGQVGGAFTTVVVYTGTAP
jgi:hypothetical protein